MHGTTERLPLAASTLALTELVVCGILSCVLATADYVVGHRTVFSSLTSRKSPKKFQINSGTLAKCLIWSAYAGD